MASTPPDDARTPGRRVVYAIYVASTATAAVFGLVLGFVLDRGDAPQVGGFGPITFALTPVNLAIFGVVMVGLMLTVGLVLVRWASVRSA